MTDEQKSAILTAISNNGLDGAGNSAAANALNNIEVVGETVVNDKKCLIPKPEILALLSDESVVALQAFIDGGETVQAQAFRIRWDSVDNLDCTHASTIASMEAVRDAGLITADECSTILANGLRQKYLCDSLLGRPLTADDIEEAKA